MEMFDDMFRELKAVTNTNEFACHGLKEERRRLNPIYKNDTDEIGLTGWKNFHGANPIYISENDILSEIVTKKTSVAVHDLIAEKRNAPCFTHFGIRSIFVIPILSNNDVAAFIVIPVLGEAYHWTDEMINICENIVSKYNDLIVNSEVIFEKCLTGK
jgi:acetolactate synthase-1/2/3 large subunit